MDKTSNEEKVNHITKKLLEQLFDGELTFSEVGVVTINLSLAYNRAKQNMLDTTMADSFLFNNLFQ